MDRKSVVEMFKASAITKAILLRIEVLRYTDREEVIVWPVAETSVGKFIFDRAIVVCPRLYIYIYQNQTIS